MERLLQISNNEYHARPELSHSQLSKMSVPAIFLHEVLNGKKTKQTAAMKLGTLVHTLVLEPETFDLNYAMAEKFDKRYSGEKDREKAFLEANAGKILLEEGDLINAKEMANSVRAHREASTLMEDAIFERSIIWNDKLTGVPLRCRPDGLRLDIAVKIDLKTAEDISPEAFSKALNNKNYATQAAFYRDGCTDAGINIEHDVLIAVCSSPPYLCAVYEIDDEAIEWGRVRYRRWLDRYVECEKSDVWPGYTGIRSIGLPAWAKMEDE